jgi:hypothetical protein
VAIARRCAGPAASMADMSEESTSCESRDGKVAEILSLWCLSAGAGWAGRGGRSCSTRCGRRPL